MGKWIRRSIFFLIIIEIVFALSGAYDKMLEMEIIAAFSWDGFRVFMSWFFAVYIFLIMALVFFENKNPSKMIAWLLVLAVLPGVGFVFYILFGRNIAKRRRSTKKKNTDENRMAYAAKIQRDIMRYVTYFKEMNSPVASRLAMLLMNSADAPFLINNRVDILTNGDETFSKILYALESAKDHIHMEYYIIRDDKIGTEIKNVLIKKAKEGIKVRLIYDSVGCWKLSAKYVHDLKLAGVEMYPFFPVALPILSRELNYRNHRKIVVVDGRVGFVGGLNIGDEYLGRSKQFGFWRDTHMAIWGEAVYGLQNTFINDWNFVSRQTLDSEVFFPKQAHQGDTIVQIAASGPDSEWHSIEQAYFTMVSSAKSRVYITTPYLVPGESMMSALKTAALSGVDVRIVIPAKPDHFLVYWASRDNIESLLEAGVRIYAYEKGFVHSKVVIVDSEVSTVGTANFDLRSFQINFEVNAFIYDGDVAQKLERDFFNDLDASSEINLETHLNRGIHIRFLESLGRLVSPLQ
ncbi:cardiolipin synthase [Fusibacter sp. JL216-2]|uniref:cardiolipin synthase n=1 Tax=Fusibacter sp. JL216-2 TaxID=3071453 RepID=UPI003D32D53A